MSVSADRAGETGGPAPEEGVDRTATPARVRPKRDWGLLVGLPLFVLATLAGWAIWRQTAGLDEIETRALDWATVRELTWEHIVLTVVSALLVVLVAVPLGVLLTRPGVRRLTGPVVGVANIGQAAPSIGLVVLLAMWLGFGFRTMVVALTVYAVLPVLQNTITGLLGVDRGLLEAARGMGMSKGNILLRVELPLAVPVIMSGVRTALILLVGTATFATFIDAGGLGELIDTGIKLFRYSILISGALLVALLALLIDWVGRVLEAVVRPKGL